MNYLDLYQDSFFPFTLSYSHSPTPSLHINMYICVIVYMCIIYEKYEFPLTLLDSLRPKFQMLLFSRLNDLFFLGTLPILVLYLGNKNYSKDFPYITKCNHWNHEIFWKHRNWIIWEPDIFFSNTTLNSSFN